jgi:hypothetical protein
VVLLEEGDITSQTEHIKIASSSVVNLEVATSFEIGGCKDLRNHSKRKAKGIGVLINLLCLRHSWI